MGGRLKSTFVLGDAGIDDAGNVVFVFFDVGEEVVFAFLVFVLVLDFDVLDGDLFFALDHVHAGSGLGFFFLGSLVLFFLFAGSGDVQRRFLDRCGFFFLGLGFGLLVLLLGFLVLGLFGLDRAYRVGLAAAALLVECLGLEREAAFGAFDGTPRKIVEARRAAGAGPFRSKIRLDQGSRSHEEVFGGARLPLSAPPVKVHRRLLMPPLPEPQKTQPLRALKAPSLSGTARVPGDKSISQRALILGAMAEGESRICGLLESEDVLNTAGAVQALGASVIRDNEGLWRVAGVGLGRWTAPHGALDFGNSGTGSRLMMGAVATTPITATFTGDASLRQRPMARVLDPLTQFGMRYQAQGPKALMPVTMMGAGDAAAITTEVKVASAQVKSALLLAALNAKGESRITQKALTRDHSEKMLEGFGAQISIEPLKGGGETVHLRGKVALKGCEIEVPRDPSSAAFPLVAALIVPGSEITLPAILLNPRRIGLIETLEDMGADIRILNWRVSGGEEIGDLVVKHSPLRGVTVPADRAPSMIDEYPILAIAASFAHGNTVMQGLEELRVKESDRLSAIARGLEANGVAFRETQDGLTVHGKGKVKGGGTVATHMDHRIAMSFLTMGLASENPVTVDDTAMIATSFPAYLDLMRTLGAEFG